MSISREATALRNESPDRELYGFRGDSVFAPLDLTLFEVDGTGNSRMIVPPPSNVEFKDVRIMSGPGSLASIASYDVPPIITKPFVKADLFPGARAGLDKAYDLNTYSSPATVTSGIAVCLFSGRSGTVNSNSLVSRLFAGNASSLMVYEVDFGVLADYFHGSQVFIGNSITRDNNGNIENELLGMLITTSKAAGSFSLVFPANSIR